ncbi:MAG TPA: reverse transcriptase domain-containing protein, partial [Chloroflexota bacterium]|nr:reverse transcriptase domain-containing protein [Chloroflexota bacterium]
MLTAEDYLHIVRDRGRRGLPLADVYRQLFNPALYLHAYGKIHANAGAMTPGSTTETADGMSLRKIQAIIALLRQEKYRWTPVRRVYIEKKHSTKKRPLGVPTWSDKLLQEVIRLIFEAYYEPQFSPTAHGFRPNRGRGTALTEIYHTWKGTVWFIEGDISACFDSLDHDVLLSIIRERIHDNRFLRLIENLLKAGYLEEWRYRKTLSGCPQGGIVSPILSNIYLDRLDKFVETTLLPAYNRGAKRKLNPAYRSLTRQLTRAHRQGQHDAAKRCRQLRRQQPSVLLDDPDYRRLRYLRYADDFLLGFTGPRSEAEAIREQLAVFLRDELRLELSPTKTLITHGRTEAARFLGYDLSVHHADHALYAGQRTLTSGIALRVPHTVVTAAASRYMRNKKPIHRAERLHDDVFTIIRGYEAEYRGIVEYYRMATNLHALNYLKLVMQTSLVKTLAAKLRISASQVYRRYAARYDGRKVLQVTITREGKPPLQALWGKTDLVRRTTQDLNDAPRSPVGSHRNELVKRLLADTCELCGAQDHIEVHHIRALKDLKRPGRADKPQWMQVMAARRRKTLVLCHACHGAVH